MLVCLQKLTKKAEIWYYMELICLFLLFYFPFHSRMFYGVYKGRMRFEKFTFFLHVDVKGYVNRDKCLILCMKC